MTSILDGFLSFANDFYEFDGDEVFNGPDAGLRACIHERVRFPLAGLLLFDSSSDMI
ncbi:MAG: hypothetical protein MN733_33305 [Nitrososphaera sp.]|nr:hypothetical protein [Nitrososphaera sp.]